MHSEAEAEADSNTDAVILAYLDAQYVQQTTQQAKRQKTTLHKTTAANSTFVKALLPSELWHIINEFYVSTPSEAHTMALVCKGTCVQKALNVFIEPMIDTHS